MALISNTRKVFNFRFEMPGLIPFLVQKFTPPTIELESVEHGEGNIKIKTAGKILIGDATLEKLKLGAGVDPWAFQQLALAQDQITGGGNPEEIYKQIANLYELAPDGITPVGIWILEGCWIKKIDNGDYDVNSSDNMIEKVTISVDKCYKINT
jgi:hypothetical protein